MRKILIEVQIDWEDYDDVCDELIIEDAITILKTGVTWKVLPRANVISKKAKLELLDGMIEMVTMGWADGKEKQNIKDMLQAEIDFLNKAD